MSGPRSRYRNAPRRNPTAVRRLLRCEALEPRMLLSVSPVRATNLAPTVANAICINGGNAVLGRSASLTVLGKDDAGEAALTYNWSVTSAPSGGAATFSLNGNNTAKNDTVSFTKAGTYSLTVKITDAGGLSVSSKASVVVNPTLSSVSVLSAAGQPLTTSVPLRVPGVSQALAAQGFDQFGNTLSTQPSFKWSTTAAPSGVPMPGLAASGAKATLTFSKIGSYGVAVQSSTSTGTTFTGNATLLVVAQPTYIIVSQVGSATGVAGTTAQFTVSQFQDQFHNLLPLVATVSWATNSAPKGAPAPTFTPTGSTTTVTFKAAGQYVLTATERDNFGNSVSQSVTVNVGQAVAGFKNVPTAPLNVTGKTAVVATPTLIDQFGSTMAVPALTWAASQLPGGAPAPTFKTSGASTTVTFAMAGAYVLSAQVTGTPSISFTTTVLVGQTLTSIAVTPGTARIIQGIQQQFSAQGQDQFQRALATQPAFTWSASGGTIAAGLFTAPTAPGNYTITAKNGTLAATATVAVTTGGNLQNAALAKLVQSLDADGSLNRQDMIQVLRSVGADGTVDAGEFADLKTILNQAPTLNIPGYVQILAADVVNGNAANATFQGQNLGNLAAGSSATQLNKLVDKWFLGADYPTLCNASLVYKSVAGSLFPRTPSHLDEYQGLLGDCYFISALGTLADSNPAAVQNMFIDNGDGTFTVRFYTGNYGTIYNYTDGSISAGFKDNIGTADYVTVDRMLPTSTSGILAYANYGASYNNASNSLWIPLAEKAYAQWNQTGKEGRDGLNAYASIQGGWMATVDAQVLGHNATDYIMTSTGKQVAISALAAKKAVTIGTLQWSGTNLGLYGSHAYAIVGYSAATDTFTLYNPWGSNQPGQLTWSQLQATCSQLAVADTAGTFPISGSPSATPTTKTSASAWPSAVATSVSASWLSTADQHRVTQAVDVCVASPSRQLPRESAAVQTLLDAWVYHPAVDRLAGSAPTASLAQAIDAALCATVESSVDRLAETLLD